MPFRFGMIIVPMSILLLLFKQKGPVSKFAKAGAVSAQTARRPQTVDISGPELLHLPGAVRRHMLVDMGDGRFYVDVPAWRRRRRRMVILVISIAVGGCAAVIGWWMISGGSGHG